MPKSTSSEFAGKRLLLATCERPEVIQPCLPWTVVPPQQYSELIIDGPARQSVELWKTSMIAAS
jgi:hypothetical protein